jgi:hypothetical protein
MLGDDEGILVAAMMIYFFHLVSSGLIHCAMMPDVCFPAFIPTVFIFINVALDL